MLSVLDRCRRTPRRALVATILGLAAAWGAPVAAADQAPVSLTVTPSTLTLAPRDSAKGIVVVTNATAASAPVHLRPVEANPALTVTLAGDTKTVPAGGSAAFDFTVARAAEGTDTNLAVSFVAEVGAGTPPAAQIVVASLPITAAARPVLAQATIVSNISEIDENRPGQVALEITNPRDLTASITVEPAEAPDGVTIALGCPGAATTKGTQEQKPTESCSFQLPPHALEVVDVGLHAGDAVAPGPRALLLAVTATEPATGLSETTVATTNFSVGIFAESDILKAIGVPIFLLLPGVILVLTGWFLLRHASPLRQRVKDDTLGNLIVSVPAGTAVVGLAASLALAAFYPFLTRAIYPGHRRDYLRAYGFRDFYYVFGYGFAIAIAACLALWVCYGLLASWRWTFVPLPDDPAPDLLRKVGMRRVVGGTAHFPAVKPAANAKALLRVARRRDGKDLVANPICLKVIDKQAERAATLKSHVEEASNGEHAFVLWWTVRGAVRQDRARIAYKPGLAAPRLDDRATLTPTGQTAAIVEIEAE